MVALICGMGFTKVSEDFTDESSFLQNSSDHLCEQASLRLS